MYPLLQIIKQLNLYYIEIEYLASLLTTVALQVPYSVVRCSPFLTIDFIASSPMIIAVFTIVLDLRTNSDVFRRFVHSVCPFIQMIFDHDDDAVVDDYEADVTTP